MVRQRCPRCSGQRRCNKYRYQFRSHALASLVCCFCIKPSRPTSRQCKHQTKFRTSVPTGENLYHAPECEKGGGRESLKAQILCRAIRAPQGAATDVAPQPP